MYLYVPLLCDFLFFLLRPLSNANQQPLIVTPPPQPNFTVSFNETITSFLTNKSIPGLSLAITKNDRLVHAAGYGYADIASQTPVTTTHRFRQASVSKTITAVAVLYLAQQNQLRLDSTVFGESGILGSKYSSKRYSDWETNITVRNLLDHSSGFVDGEMCGPDCDPTYSPQWLDLDQWDLVRAVLDSCAPGHAPGTVASYSNFGYFVLGRVVEEVVGGGVSYSAFVRDEILGQRLGISAVEIAGDERGHDEVVYYEDDARAPYSFHVARRDSVGAWIASSSDLLRILTAVDGSAVRRNILNEDFRGEMFAKSSVDGSEYGLGWDEVLEREDGKTGLVGKSGGYAGTNSWVAINFETNVSYAVVVNKQVSAPDGGGRGLKNLVEELLESVDQWPDHDLFDDK